MSRIGFEWTDWSTPPVTATIVVGSWGLTFLVVALLASLLGFEMAASAAFVVAKAIFAGAAALFGVAVVAGISLEKRTRGTAQAVERPVR